MRIRRAELEKQREAAKALKQNQQASMDSFVFQSTEQNAEQPVLITEQDGMVSLEVIGPAVGETVATGRRRTLAGVSTTTLRRTVIDQMIRDNGWVENDYHKDVAGNKVYVVVAKAPDKKNRVQARTYYFAESNGRIYRVSSRAPDDSSDEAAKQSEQMIRSLQVKQRTQQALNQ